MSVHEELSTLAAARTAKVVQYEEECSKAAQAFARALHRYLGAPEANVVYRDLLPGLVFDKFRWPVTRAFPGFMGNRDGWLYFAIATTFADSEGEPVFVGTSLFGVRQRGERFVLLSGKKEREFHPTDAAVLERICGELADEYRRYLSSAVNDESQAIGFRLE